MRTIVVFSGAGLSAESGLPTFRGPGGLWENYRVEEVAQHQAWWRDKALVLRFYEERFLKYRNCQPNAGHRAIADLQRRFRVVNITQNIDNLLEQAGCTNVIHLHGKATQAKCERHHDISNRSGDTFFVCDYKVEITQPIRLGDLCQNCSSQLRPDVVFFNEAVDFDDEAMAAYAEEIMDGGVFICVGTSAQVYPAAGLIPLFSGAEHKYFVDPKPQVLEDFEILKGTAAEMLPDLAKKLLV
jgi:NAD-dependent deacetylase